MIVLLGADRRDGRQRARASASPTSCPASLAAQIDWEATYVNSLHGGRHRGAPRRGCRWCCPTRSRASGPRWRRAAGRSTQPKRVVRIASTLHLDALLGERRPARRAACGRSDVVGRRVGADGRHVLHRRARPTATSGSCRPTWPAGRGIPTPATAGRRPALLVRALERALPELRLARISVDLGRPVPMAGLHDRTPRSCAPAGRPATRRAAIVDGDGDERVTATGMHVAVSRGAAVRAAPRQQRRRRRHGSPTPCPASSRSAASRHGLPGFRDAVEVRYPRRRGQPARARPRCGCARVPLLPDEEPSPFQRICPLADCGNAFTRHADPTRCSSSTPTSSIALHRDPVGEWLGSRAVSHVAADGRRPRRRPAVRRRGPGRAGAADAAAAAGRRDRSAAPPTLAEVVGADHVLVDPDVTASYATDWTGRFRGEASLVVRPADAAEVAAVAARRAPTPAPRSSRRAATPVSSAAACPRERPMVVLSTRRLDDARPGRRRRACR